MMTFLMIVWRFFLLFCAVALLRGLRTILISCYDIYRLSRSKDEDVDSLEEVVVDQHHQLHQHNQLQHHRRNIRLSDISVMKHIYPGCRTNQEAEIFSWRRNILSAAETNTVFKAPEWDFQLDLSGTYFKSNSPVPYWQCEKMDTGEFKVIPGF